MSVGVVISVKQEFVFDESQPSDVTDDTDKTAHRRIGDTAGPKLEGAILTVSMKDARRVIDAIDFTGRQTIPAGKEQITIAWMDPPQKVVHAEGHFRETFAEQFREAG